MRYEERTDGRGHIFKRDKYGEIDIFAFEQGDHNGPECLACREKWCHHCVPFVYEEFCSANHGG